VSGIAPSFLSRRNPTVKGGLVLVLSLLLVLVLDPITPLLFLVPTLAAGVTLGRVPPRAYARAVIPLVMVGLGFVWTNALFAGGGADDVTHAVGPLSVSERGLAFGLAIALRGLAIGALSLTFVLTTDPTDLAVSLVRHAKLPFRIVYALLAGYRFLPFFSAEYAQVRLAQRLRGGGVRRAVVARAGEPFRLLLPLLALAIRRASRIGVAMDSRGFSAADGRTRTTLRVVQLDGRDAVFALATGGAAVGLMWISAAAGWLRLWDGRFAA
jgi:energy-coupling factor transport system permease protein